MEGRMTIERMGEIMQTILRQLGTAGQKGGPKDIFAAAEKLLKLTPYERETSSKTGYMRWRAHASFYSIDCLRAGYIEKVGGYWILTQQGEAALKMPPGEFIRSATAKYRAWKSARDAAPVEQIEADDVESESVVRQTVYEQSKELARQGIEEHINNLEPYDFQKLVAELLTAMDYYVPHVAPPGRDGGIDLVAYRDPLGTSAPRIKVQVKHRDQKLTVKEVRELEGLLRKEGDIGLLVSSGGFTGEVEREIRASTKHIETMDLDRLIDLWQRHYEKIGESGKTLLPLVRVHFLAPAEE